MALNIYFATNRKILKEGDDAEIGEEFHPNIDELRFGKASFAGKDLFKKDLDSFMGKAKISLAPEKLDKEDAGEAKLGSKAVFDEVRAEMLKKGDALIFVHGYDHKFREAAGRAAQLQQWLAAGGKDMTLLLFSWPSAAPSSRPRTSSATRRATSAATGASTCCATRWETGRCAAPFRPCAPSSVTTSRRCSTRSSWPPPTRTTTPCSSATRRRRSCAAAGA
jgi:hypothetical protein